MRLLIALAGVAVASAADGFVHHYGYCRDSTATAAVSGPSSYHIVPSVGACFDICLNQTSSGCGAVQWYYQTGAAYNALYTDSSAPKWWCITYGDVYGTDPSKMPTQGDEGDSYQIWADAQCYIRTAVPPSPPDPWAATAPYMTYHAAPGGISFSDARAACQALPGGGDLASIHNEVENQMAYALHLAGALQVGTCGGGRTACHTLSQCTDSWLRPEPYSVGF